MKDKLRELAERWRIYGSHITGHECADELLEILDAEGDGGADERAVPVAEVFERPVHHDLHNSPMMKDIRFTGMPLPIGAKLYAHPHSPDAADSGRVDESTEQRARAWDAVVSVLEQVSPRWWDSPMNGMDCAVSAIRALAAQGQGEAARPMLKRDGVQIDLTAHCPFCGCEDELRHAPNDYATDGGQMGQPNVDPFFVHCDGCGCDGPVGESEQDALNLWNNRDRTAPAGEAGGVPDGMVLVPCEPTEAMYEQMYEVKMYVAFDRFRRDWSRMLAAPSAPEGDGGGE